MTRCAAVWLTIAGGFLPASLSARQLPLEYSVKASYIYNFASFVEWPVQAFPRADTPFRICIAGTDPFRGVLHSTVRGESVNGHPIVVERLKDDADVATCQVLFVGQMDDARMASLIRSTERLPVLVVAETRRALELCANIALVVDGDRVRFDINRAALERQGLKASARLLRAARDTSTQFRRCG